MKELSRDAQALLELARRSDRPRDGDREQVAAGLSGLGVGIASVAAGTPAIAATGTAAQAGSAATGLTALGAKILFPALIGFAVGGAAMAPLLFHEPERPPPANSARQPAPADTTAANAHAVVPAVTAQAPSTPDTSPAAPAASNALPSIARHGAAPSPARSKREETLLAEAELLAAASGALGSGRAQQALELLDQHEQKYADGVLAEERAAARVLALCEIGRTAEARGLAEQFLQRAPRSPLVPRVRGSCAFAQPEAPSNQVTETPGSGHTAREPKQ